MKKYVSILVICLLLSLCFSVSSEFSSTIKTTSSGNTLYVGGNGPGNYSTIYEGIDAANDGDTVFVYNGIYNENLGITKSIKLKGEDKNNTIINGEFDSVALHLHLCKNVIITRFTIKQARNVGILVSGTDNIISDNIIINNNIGIQINDKNNIINHNDIKYNDEYGIDIRYVYNNIENNNIFENTIGIYIRNDENLIFNNEIHNNVKGLYFQRTSENIISNNNINENYYGIYSDKPTIPSSTSALNQINFNNFIKNKDNLYRYQNNQFDSNYWDD